MQETEIEWVQATFGASASSTHAEGEKEQTVYGSAYTRVL